LKCQREANGGQQVFAYFNNDPDAIATANARSLLNRLGSE